MSISYQVHIKTIGQMTALISHYRERDYDIPDYEDIPELLRNYPWIVLVHENKYVGGNRAARSGYTTIPFDQAFDLPVKNEVEFTIGETTITCGKTTLDIKVGALAVQLPMEDFVRHFVDARIELSK